MDVRFRVTRKRLVAAVAVLAVVTAGAAAYAAIPSASTNTFTGCMLKATGTIRLIDPTLSSGSLLSHCTTVEQAISWNQKGVPGAAGAAGKDGAPGTNGVNGAPGAACLPSNPACVGPAGPAGPAGKDGTNGSNGAAGAAGAKGDPGSGFTWRGAYQDRTVYQAGDVVFLDGSTWITNEQIGSGDIAPPDDPWQLLAAKGANGAKGADGTNGSNGSNGANGATGSQGPQGQAGPQGPQGPAGPAGPSGSATASRDAMAVAVNANGTPQIGGFTVKHSSAGSYELDFPPGTFAGSVGHFPICVANAINSTATWVSNAAASAIPADGSGTCQLNFADASGAADTLFTAIVSPTP